MNKIFTIPKPATRLEGRPITMSVVPIDSPPKTCSLLQKDSTYFNTYGRPCQTTKGGLNKVEVFEANKFLTIHPEFIFDFASRLRWCLKIQIREIPSLK